jgi:hypothetical protein
LNIVQALSFSFPLPRCTFGFHNEIFSSKFLAILN